MKRLIAIAAAVGGIGLSSSENYISVSAAQIVTNSAGFRILELEYSDFAFTNTPPTSAYFWINDEYLTVTPETNLTTEWDSNFTFEIRDCECCGARQLVRWQHGREVQIVSIEAIWKGTTNRFIVESNSVPTKRISK